MRNAILIVFGALFLSVQSAPAQDLPSGSGIDQGLWWLYHLQYDKALANFDLYIASNPKDPTGYFYRTATNWWHLAQEFEYQLPDVQKQFETDAQKTIEVAQALVQSTKDPKTKSKAYLYWGGAEGLRGRWLVTQHEWVSAYFAGKRGDKYLKKALDYDPTQYDAYMGLGIYDYFTDTMSGVQAVLAALLIHGDKVRGLKELHIAIDKSDHARVEAQTFLVEIYNAEEHTPEKALPISEALHKEFPQSPAMHLMLMSTLYVMKDWNAMLPQAQEILEKSEKADPWYDSRTTKAAQYCIGVGLLFGKHDLDGATKEFATILDGHIDENRWITFALLRQGQIYDLRGERDKAMVNYRQVLSRLDTWDTHKEASQPYIKTPFTFFVTRA